MGQLVDGVWQDTWYDTKSTGGVSNVLFRPSVTGSLPTVRLARAAKAALRLRKIVTTSMFLWPVRGRIAP